MLRAAIIISSAVLLLLSCGKKAEPATAPEPVDTIPMMISQLRKCSRLYTSEYRIHKIITHEDQVKLSGTVLQKDFNIDLPIGERRSHTDGSHSEGIRRLLKVLERQR